ncbi:MAG: DUF4143 domain-containing protein [Clostridium sp.]|nr:DUF4143 domain-containing protein [Clostridium sp.]MCM1444487.1 DUF4143 domain-containing protein [Candidatus Amulumruptor caecigallinarius]
MDVDKREYKPRLVDEKIELYLDVFGAISIEGPKWCGKTWSSLYHSKSNINLSDDEVREKVEVDTSFALNGATPRLIDEWNLVPGLWDRVRNRCDATTKKGNYILTCSTKLTDKDQKEKVKHSGAGRIGKIKMKPMSLYESGDSTGQVSIMDMYNKTQEFCNNNKLELSELANLIVRGGWPGNITKEGNKSGIIPKEYIENILDVDMNNDKTRDKIKMMMLLKSLARNESTIVSNKTLMRDIEENEIDDNIGSSNTVEDYLDALERLHIIDNQYAYTENYRSRERVGKASKRHFTDPSLACAILGLNQEKLLNDIKTFGFMFESLVERDLDIYMNYLNGKLYHFRDNVSGLEVDSILEFEDGEYAAVEIKLGFNQVDEAKKNLIKFKKNMIKEPKFMCIIVGILDACLIDEETGIYILPITALKP